MTPEVPLLPSGRLPWFCAVVDRTLGSTEKEGSWLNQDGNSLAPEPIFSNVWDPFMRPPDIALWLPYK